MKIRVGVFFGGNSTEHEVSIVSAVQAMYSFDTQKYEIVPVYITKNNYFYTGDDLFEIKNYTNMKTLLAKCKKVYLAKKDNGVDLMPEKVSLFNNGPVATIDIAFPIVHGTNVEDGTLQGFFHMYDLPYVGSNILGSAIGMDKAVCKDVLSAAGIPVLPCARYSEDEDTEAVIKDVEARFAYPVIVKPMNLGSSIGICVAHDKNELEEALDNAFSFSERVLVERAITKLREINCAVLGDNEEAIASECEEPIASDEILDFNQKYLSETGSKSAGTMQNYSRKFPAEISKEQRDFIRTTAIKAFKTVGCSGVARVDMMIDGEDGSIYVNELNTIPGSLSFYLWKPMGIEYSELLDRMIDLAVKRNRKESARVTSFDTNILQSAASNGSLGVKGVKYGKN